MRKSRLFKGLITVYLLTDIAGDHCWLGDRFVPMAETQDYPDEVPCFFTAAAGKKKGSG
jgi:hypothetical protein